MSRNLIFDIIISLDNNVNGIILDACIKDAINAILKFTVFKVTSRLVTGVGDEMSW